MPFQLMLAELFMESIIWYSEMFCRLIVSNGLKPKIIFYFLVFFAHLHNHKPTPKIM